ncbi:MAG: ABC transporter permease, partial [Candidatus Thermoplasmatota archaeon]|nr:ABC transporter permease [Candidatus Thermoplasmatota archaeon]
MSWREKLSRAPSWLQAGARELPDRTRLALLSAWRGRSRGLAVFTGVFLASLVITTVLVYGSGLMQIFFVKSLDGEYYDFRMDFHTDKGGKERATNVTLWESYCDDYVALPEVTDCAVIAGKQGGHGAGWFTEEYLKPQPLELHAWEGDGKDWSQVAVTIPFSEESGPPTSEYRPVRLLGPSAYDGVLAERHASRLLSGTWPDDGDEAVALRYISLPSQVASEANAGVGDRLSSLTFTYDKYAIQGCVGEEVSWQLFSYCRVSVTLTNLTIGSIYDDTIIASPVTSQLPVFLPWELLPIDNRSAIIGGDHAYLAIAIDRTALPTESTDIAEDELDRIQRSLDEVALEGEVNLDGTHVIKDTIGWLQIQNYFIQIFNYIVMIPIIILSVSVLLYGLLLSLEQRRREIAIHRVIGGGPNSLLRMVLGELGVVAFAAWIAGYVLALFAVPLVLNAVGFMQFRPGEYDVSPSLGLLATLATLIVTVGLTLLFGRSRTRDFLEQEISEGVQRVVVKPQPRYWLHWLLFSIGLIALADSYIQSLASDGRLTNDWERGIISNPVLNGIFAVLGPFLLWIGGALVLARLGAAAPWLVQRLLGKTAVLRDIGRGLRGSGSAEGVGKLALIMLLTLSIVTMASIQGYTGMAVDERTASLNAGADLKVDFQQPVDHATALATVSAALDGTDVAVEDVRLVTVPLIATHPAGDEYSVYQTLVVLDGNRDVIRWDRQTFGGDPDATLDKLAADGFSYGELLQFSVGGESQLVLNLTGASDNPQTTVGNSGQHEWYPGLDPGTTASSIFIGEASFRALVGDTVADGWHDTTWFIELGAQGDGDAQRAIARTLVFDGSVSRVTSWE